MRYAPFAIACLLVVAGCGEAPVATTTAETEIVETTPAVFNASGAPTIALETPDMHCGACAAGICEALKEVPGVVDVKADADTKVATLAIDESAFDTAAAIEAIAAANFGEATLVDDAEPAEAAEEGAAAATAEATTES